MVILAKYIPMLEKMLLQIDSQILPCWIKRYRHFSIFKDIAKFPFRMASIIYKLLPEVLPSFSSTRCYQYLKFSQYNKQKYLLLICIFLVTNDTEHLLEFIGQLYSFLFVFSHFSIELFTFGFIALYFIYSAYYYLLYIWQMLFSLFACVLTS